MHLTGILLGMGWNRRYPGQDPDRDLGQDGVTGCKCSYNRCHFVPRLRILCFGGTLKISILFFLG